MVEAAVALIDVLGSKIAEKLLEEVSAFTDFREDFEFLCDQLVLIKSLLKEAGEERNSRLISVWFEKLQDFVDDAAYVVEDCEAAPKFGNVIFRKFGNLSFRYKMSRRIRNLKERLSKIYESAKYVQNLISVVDANARFATNNPEEWRERSSSLLLKRDQAVGMDANINAVTGLILQRDGDQVIGVVRMGGLGKTFLLQHVFNSDEVKKCFGHRFWLAISQSYSVKQLRFEGSKQIGLKLDRNKDLTPEDLRDRIHTHLAGKRCLFVLDDVWNSRAFKDLNLPSEGQNKFLVSTREKHVAEEMGCSHPHQMKCLSEENSLKLFCMYAFPDRSDHSPPENLTRVAHRILEKCGGLPLAVTTLGAYMARARNEEWESTLQRLNEAQPRTIRDDVRPSLRLSYEALPRHLKSCYLYCCHFPKNTEIDCEYLVHGWIAQGFVSTREVSEAYDVGLSYIDELIDRCLLEISMVGSNGRVSSCKIHDLLHDLAVSESEKQTKCFLKAGGERKQLTVEECRGVERISLMKNEVSKIEEGIRCPRLRTLLLSGNEDLEFIPSSFLKNFAYLTVLDLSHTSITSLPETVGDLKHLKLLNLSWTNIKKLPESLSGLRLPVGISELINLRTLKGAIFRTENAANAKASLQVMDLKGLTLLRDLSFELCDGIQLQEGIFGGMTEMRRLSIENDTDAEPLQLPNDMKNMERLERVSLTLCKVPEWIIELQYLTMLSLDRDTSSTAEEYKGFEKIPNLRTLQLFSNEKLIELPEKFGEAMAFPKLEDLWIYDFSSLEKFPVFHDGTMPMLKSFTIGLCPLLKDIPQGLERLKNLENVDVYASDAKQAEDIRNSQSWRSLENCQMKIKVTLYKGGKPVEL